jgi:hypothetical protein
LAGIVFEFSFGIFLIYPVPIGRALNTRSLASPHFAVPTFIYFSIMWFYDELRRVYVRQGIKKDPITNKVQFTGWFARNTLW